MKCGYSAVTAAVPVMRLAEQVDLAGLVAGRVRPDLSTGANPGGNEVSRILDESSSLRG
jgi:hypothetical protein